MNQVKVPTPNPAATAPAPMPTPPPVQQTSAPSIPHANSVPLTTSATIYQPLEPGVLVPAATNQPVPPLTGKQRAVLIGINYEGTRAKLRGCHNDVKATKQLLERQYGWRSSDIQILMDDGVAPPPTRANITAAMKWMVEQARPGDVFFFHFSGHGAQQEDKHGLESDGMY